MVAASSNPRFEPDLGGSSGACADAGPLTSCCNYAKVIETA